MSIEYILILILLGIITTVIVGCIIFIGFQIVKELKKRRKLQEIALYSEMFRNITGIYDLLDSYIQERLNEYRIFNPDIFERGVLSNAQQAKIIKDVTVDVLYNMSPAFYSQLALVFDPNKEKIQKIVNNRVLMAVLGWNLENEEVEQSENM